MELLEMLKDVKEGNINGITAWYYTYLNFDSDAIKDKLKELWKTTNDIEDAFIKWGTLKVMFKWDKDYIDLLEGWESENDFKRPDSIDTY